MELPDPDGGPVFRVQVKEYARTAPSPRSLLEQADIVFYHYTTGKMDTRTFVVISDRVLERFLNAHVYLQLNMGTK